jgi:hypothetical protein
MRGLTVTAAAEKGDGRDTSQQSCFSVCWPARQALRFLAAHLIVSILLHSDVRSREPLSDSDGRICDPARANRPLGGRARAGSKLCPLSAG